MQQETTASIRGSMTALVTPFKGGDVDFARLEALVDRQVEAGTDWLVALGTTGEVPTLSAKEREVLLEAVIRRAAGRRPVMAGTGSYNTTDTVIRSKEAANAGASALLLVAPYYNRPTQEGMFRHFATVAESVELPLVLYNVPARTGVDINNDTIVRLSEAYPHVTAVKDATGGVDRITDLAARCSIAVLSGDDALTWPLMALGAVGVISVLSNLRPSVVKSLVTAALAGDVETARSIHRRIDDLATGLNRLGPNPVPIKTAMAIAGLIEEEFRLPLCPLDAEARPRVEQLLRRHEIVRQITR